MITRHPDIDYLVDYSTGSLELAPRISITAHLQYCEQCRSQADSLTAVGGAILADSEAVAVNPGLLDSILDHISEEEAQVSAAPARKAKRQGATGELPEFVQNLLPETLEWRSLSKSLRVAPIPVGERKHELALHRIAAGGKAPTHGHRGLELTVVLKGSFSDEEGVYQEGDFLVRGPEDVHRPLAAQHEECICLSVLEAPIRLTGLKKVLNPFLGFSPA